MTDQQQMEISDNAASRIAYLLAQEEDPTMKLRITVDGGGCSGFQYKFDFDPVRHEDDVMFERGSAQVLVDRMSLGFLQGSVLDYIESLGAAHFEIRNPNAKATCGCGNSFAV